MTIRRFSLGLCLLFAWASTSVMGLASDRRMTPIVRAIQRIKYSAVNIHTEKTTYGDSLFASSKGRKVNGMGTGVVVDERGYIATNYHVVNGVDSMRCTLYDGSTYMAQVVSFDSEKDIALIKIHASRPLKVMPLGTSSDLMLGETVLALGNAYGYEHSVTAGIVSSLSRDVEVNEKQSYENLIQTDASINPGNSGGPLVNLDGEVIGINVAIRAGAQRIGFAIPIDDARRIIAKLLSIEQIDGTWHGVVAEDVKSADKQELRIRRIQPDSPAGTAGLSPGDVIVKAGSLDITDGVDWELRPVGPAHRRESPHPRGAGWKGSRARSHSRPRQKPPRAFHHPKRDPRGGRSFHPRQNLDAVGHESRQDRRAKPHDPRLTLSRRHADYRHPPRQPRREQRTPRRRHPRRPAHLGNRQPRKRFLRPRSSRPRQIRPPQVLHPPRRRNPLRPPQTARPKELTTPPGIARFFISTTEPNPSAIPRESSPEADEFLNHSPVVIVKSSGQDTKANVLNIHS